MTGSLMIVARAVGAVVMLFIITRILGKKQISQLTFFEYITGIALGDLAGFISTDIEANYWHGALALIVWFVLPYGFEQWSLRNRKLRNLLQGEVTEVIKGGKILENNLAKERFSGDELMEELRKKNVFKVSDVEYAVLEPTGDLNVLLKKRYQPITPSDLGLKVPAETEPVAVVMDGRILDNGLTALGKNRAWLKTELEKLGTVAENVFLAQTDAYGGLYVDLFADEQRRPEAKTKATLLATLKKCQADLELYGLTSKNPDGVATYNSAAKELDRVLKDVTPYLQG